VRAAPSRPWIRRAPKPGVELSWPVVGEKREGYEEGPYSTRTPNSHLFHIQPCTVLGSASQRLLRRRLCKIPCSRLGLFLRSSGLILSTGRLLPQTVGTSAIATAAPTACATHRATSESVLAAFSTSEAAAAGDTRCGVVAIPLLSQTRRHWMAGGHGSQYGREEEGKEQWDIK